MRCPLCGLLLDAAEIDAKAMKYIPFQENASRHNVKVQAGAPAESYQNDKRC